MTSCSDYRRAILADPRLQDPALEEHRASCAECAAFTGKLLDFEGRLARAVRVSAGGAARRVPGRRSGLLAMAASVIVALVVAGALWLGAAHSSLAADVVAHMAGEPQAWARTAVPVPSSELAAVLEGAHMSLNPSAGMVSYAQSCSFRGHKVPHLVVQTEMGPVTVMVLVHETVPSPKPFDEEGYRGVIVPMQGHGSLAVLARQEQADLPAVERVASRVENAIAWAKAP
jgi:hypothetical protein